MVYFINYSNFTIDSLDMCSMFRYLCLSLILISVSCKDSLLPATTGGFKIKVIKSSGDDFYYDDEGSIAYFAPYPFNLGQFQDEGFIHDVVILSKRVETGTMLAIHPVAELTLDNVQRGKTRVVVAVPDEHSLRIFDIQNYYDLNSKHFAIKKMIEEWYQNRYGLNGSRVISWNEISSEHIFGNKNTEGLPNN